MSEVRTSIDIAREILADAVEHSNGHKVNKYLYNKGLTRGDVDALHKLHERGEGKLTKNIKRVMNYTYIGHIYLYKGNEYSIKTLVQYVLKPIKPTYHQLTKMVGTGGNRTYDKIIAIEYPNTKHRLSGTLCRYLNITPLPTYIKG